MLLKTNQTVLQNVFLCIGEGTKNQLRTNVYDGTNIVLLKLKYSISFLLFVIKCYGLKTGSLYNGLLNIDRNIT